MEEKGIKKVEITKEVNNRKLFLTLQACRVFLTKYYSRRGKSFFELHIIFLVHLFLEHVFYEGSA